MFSKYYSIDEFKKLLQENIVQFSFIKSDSSRRDIVGTTNPGVFENKVDIIQTTRIPQNPDLVKVFDVELNEWRSFNFKNLIQSSVKVL